MTATLRAGWLAGVLALGLGGCPAADVTPPAVTARSPGPDAAEVAARSPVVVTFSEAIDPASVTGESAQLAAQGGAGLARTAHLSADGRTLTLTPVAVPSVPNRLSVRLDGLRDPAGNPLPVDAWAFDLPEWLGGGTAVNAGLGPARAARLAAGPDGTPRLALLAGPGGAVPLRLLGLDGSGWAEAAAAGPGLALDHPTPLADLAFDAAGRPVVALVAPGAVPYELSVRRWDGAAWQALGAPLAGAMWLDLQCARLAFDAQGAPLLAVLRTTNGSFFDLRVLRFDGAAWTPLGGAVNPAGVSAGVGTIAVPADGKPLVAVALPDGTGQAGRLHLRRWTGTAWETLGVALAVPGQSVVDAMMLPDPSGRPVVAGIVTPVGQYQFALFVWRWTGSAWETLGANLEGPLPGYYALAVDAAGTPLVAYDAPGGGVVVRRYGPDGWAVVGHPLPPVAGGLARPGNLKLDARGNPMVVLARPNGATTDFEVRRYNQ